MTVTFDAAALDWAKGDGLIAGGRAGLAERCRADARLYECRGFAANAAKWKSDFLESQQEPVVDQGRDVRTFPDAEIAVRADCDADTILVRAQPQGPTCHLGTASCFGDGSAPPTAFLARTRSPWSRSAIAIDPKAAIRRNSLKLACGASRRKSARKGWKPRWPVSSKSDQALLGESADLVFHLLVLLRAQSELSLDDLVSKAGGASPDRTIRGSCDDPMANAEWTADAHHRAPRRERLSPRTYPGWLHARGDAGLRCARTGSACMSGDAGFVRSSRSWPCAQHRLWRRVMNSPTALAEIAGVRDWWVNDFSASERPRYFACDSAISGARNAVRWPLRVAAFLGDGAGSARARCRCNTAASASDVSGTQAPAEYFRALGIDPVAAMHAELEGRAACSVRRRRSGCNVSITTYCVKAKETAVAIRAFALLETVPTDRTELDRLARRYRHLKAQGVARQVNFYFGTDRGKCDGLDVACGACAGPAGNHAWTFPREDRSHSAPSSRRTRAELDAAFALGVDALFCDFPDIAILARLAIMLCGNGLAHPCPPPAPAATNGGFGQPDHCRPAGSTARRCPGTHHWSRAWTPCCVTI